MPKKKRSTPKSPNCPDCAKPLSPHQQNQGVLVCPVCKGEFRKCTYPVAGKTGKERKCGGWLRWNEEDGYWLCNRCGKQFGEQSRRNPAPDVAAERRKEHEERQCHPPEWAREIVRGVEQYANNRPEAMGMFHVDMRCATAALVQEREAKEAESPSARQTSMSDPRWLLDSCPKSLLGPDGSPLPPWKHFILAAFHNGLRHAEAMGAMMPPEWSDKGPKAPPAGDPASQMRAFFDSPEYQQYQQWEEYDRYASVSVDLWQRHAPVLRRYVEEVEKRLTATKTPAKVKSKRGGRPSRPGPDRLRLKEVKHRVKKLAKWAGTQEANRGRPRNKKVRLEHFCNRNNVTLKCFQAMQAWYRKWSKEGQLPDDPRTVEDERLAQLFG